MKKAITVKTTDDISNIESDRFIFNLKTKKGFIKRNLDTSLLPTNYTFNDVIELIDNSDITTLNKMNIDGVSFRNGKLDISTKQNFKIIEEMSIFSKMGGKSISDMNDKLNELQNKWVYTGISKESDENNDSESTIFKLKINHPIKNDNVDKIHKIDVHFDLDEGNINIMGENEDFINPFEHLNQNIGLIID